MYYIVYTSRYVNILYFPHEFSHQLKWSVKIPNAGAKLNSKFYHRSVEDRIIIFCFLLNVHQLEWTFKSIIPQTCTSDNCLIPFLFCWILTKGTTISSTDKHILLGNLNRYSSVLFFHLSFIGFKSTWIDFRVNIVNTIIFSMLFCRSI